MHLTLLPLLFGIGCAPATRIAMEPCERCSITDDNQYAYDAALEADIIEVSPGADAEVDWSSVTRDLQGHAVTTADISETLLVGFRDLSPAEVTEAIATDTLRQDSVAIWLTAESTEGHARFSDYGLMGNQLDIERYVQPGITWLVAVRKPGATRIASMVFVVAREPQVADGAPSTTPFESTDEEPAQIVLDNDTSNLDVDMDFASLEEVFVQTGERGLVLDWSAVSSDGLGNPLAFPTVTDLFLGHFSEQRADLQTSVFDLEATADASWTMRLGGSSWANLDALRGDTEFAGVSDEGTWLLALSCSQCMNPAPRLVTFLAANDP